MTRYLMMGHLMIGHLMMRARPFDSDRAGALRACRGPQDRWLAGRGSLTPILIIARKPVKPLRAVVDRRSAHPTRRRTAVSGD